MLTFTYTKVYIFKIYNLSCSTKDRLFGKDCLFLDIWFALIKLQVFCNAVILLGYQPFPIEINKHKLYQNSKSWRASDRLSEGMHHLQLQQARVCKYIMKCKTAKRKRNEHTILPPLAHTREKMKKITWHSIKNIFRIGNWAWAENALTLTNKKQIENLWKIGSL